MKKAIAWIEKILVQTESWMFLALLLGCAILETNTFPPHSWGQYFSYLLFFSGAFSPTFCFIVLKEKLRKAWNRFPFFLGWAASFMVWPTLIGIYIQQTKPLKALLIYSEEAVFIIGGSFFFLASLLELYRILNTKIRGKSWTRHLSLEKAFFLILVISTLFVASVVTSNLEEFHATQKVGMSIELPKIFSHFFTFMGICLQFFLLYAVAYLFYLINHHLLISKLLKQKGILHYVMGLLGTLVLLYPIFAQLIIWLPIHQKLQVLVPSENFLPFDYLNGAVAFIIMLISLPIILVVQWFQQNNQILSLEKQHVQTELDLLKQQINPHFFFNTLNNLYGLSQKQSEHTPEVILQLSELMRYVIYRGKEQRVHVFEEINYLKDYCNLQQIRLHKKLDYKFEVQVEDDEAEIPPLLLVILVENAFKHGIEPAEHAAHLHMQLKILNDQLLFICENSFEGPAKYPGGVGLENLRRRLDLLFGENYALSLEPKDTIFKVQLSWNIQ